MRRVLKFIGRALLLLTILIVLLVVVIYIPPVQNRIANIVAQEASKGTGLTVRVDKVGLTFPLDLDVRGVVATDECGDTVLYVRRCVVDLDLSGIFSGEVGVDEVTLIDGRADSKQLLDGMGVSGRIGRFAIKRPNNVRLGSHTATLADISLADCSLDVTLGTPTEEPDTTQSEPLDWCISLRSLRLDNVRLTATTDSARMATHIAQFSVSDLAANLPADSIGTGALRANISYVEMMPILPAPLAGGERSAPLQITSIDIRSQGLCKQAEAVTLRPLRLATMGSVLTASGTIDLATLATQMSIDGSVTPLTMAVASDQLGLTLPEELTSRPLLFAFNANGDPAAMRLDDSYVELRDMLRLDLDATVCDLLGESLSGALVADLQSPAGKAMLNATLEADETYSLRLDGDIQPRSIVRDIPVRRMAFTAEASGRGLNPLGDESQMTARMDVARCALDSLTLDGLRLDAATNRGQVHANIGIDNALATCNAQLDAIMRDRLDGTFAIDLGALDLQALHVTDSALSVSACLHLDIASDLDRRHYASGALNDIRLVRPDTMLRPVDLSLDVLLRPDTTHCHFTAGEMLIDASLSGDLDKAGQQMDRLMGMLESQFGQRRLDQNALRENLPTGNIDMRIRGRNPVSAVAMMMGYPFEDLRMNLDLSPERGMNGDARIRSLGIGAAMLDDIRCRISQDSTGVRAKATVHNDPTNERAVFDAALDAWLLADGAGAQVTFDDADGRRGVDLGAVGTFSDAGLHVRLIPERPILAFRNFIVNPDNYVMLKGDGNLLANVNLLADDGTGLVVYSAEQLGDGDDDMPADGADEADDTVGSSPVIDLTASLQRINLRELSNTLPYLPQLGGFLNGDLHYINQDSTMTVALDAQIRQLQIDDAKVGDIGLMATCLPDADGTYALDGLMNIRQRDCLLFSGQYDDEQGVQVDIDLTDMPAAIINSFAGEDMAFGGSINGGVHVDSKDALRLDGRLAMRDFTLSNPAYNLNLRMPEGVMQLTDNRLLIDALRFYSTGERPLQMDGSINLGDFSDIRLDIGLKGRNFQLINAKKTASSLVYGKMYCNIDTRITGSLNDIHLNGSLGVLGNTDLTYILKDSPLTVEDRLSDLVTFTDFNNEEETVEEELPPMDLSMNMKVSIDNGTRMHCLLSEDKSSYIDIEGGGELAMTYNPLDDIQLNGRYTINSGEMKYQLPIIPLKTFKFNNGSYIEFKGKVLNPTLNISATERVRSQVADAGGASRTVLFDVGLMLSQTLENMGLQFDIDAPEDSEVQNELAMLDETTRGRVAVTMLVTGMYINENGNSAGGGDGFSTESALNSLLQSEISSLAGKALNSVDVSFGMDNTTRADGTTQTDYSFSFAKHFWGNRVSIVLGGKVSSGKDAVNDGTTIIDNVSIEYRLDKSATRYVRVFYDKAYESMLDGKITEMGAGVVLRRHTTRLGDLFIFRRKAPTAAVAH